jgi:ribosomal protein S18 acetylase RimI-like enzyme
MRKLTQGGADGLPASRRLNLPSWPAAHQYDSPSRFTHVKEIQFREVTPSDVPSLLDVRTRTRENTYTLEQLTALGITEDTVVGKLAASFKGWAGLFDDSVVGFCIADRGTGELWVIAVLPEFERQGIGDRLMALAEEWLWASGCDRAWLTTDVDTTLRAYGFYRHRGWVDWKLEGGLRWMQLFPTVTTSPRAPATP